MNVEISDTDVIVAQALPISSHSAYMTNAVLVRKCEHSITMTRSREKGCLITANDLATVVLKEKIVFDVTETAELLYLTPKAVAAPKQIL